MSQYEEKYNSKEWRAHMKALSDPSLKDHILIKEGEGRWYCQKPGTSMYSFRVVVSANTILFHGDLQDLCVVPSGPDALSWLLSTLNSKHDHLDYFMEKVTPVHRQKTFLIKEAELHLEHLREDHEVVMETQKAIQEVQEKMHDLSCGIDVLFKQGETDESPDVIELDNQIAELKDKNFELLLEEEDIDLQAEEALAALEKIKGLRTRWRELWDEYESRLCGGYCPAEQAWYEAYFDVYKDTEGIDCSDWNSQLLHQYFALKKFVQLYIAAEDAQEKQQTESSPS